MEGGREDIGRMEGGWSENGVRMEGGMEGEDGGRGEGGKRRKEGGWREDGEREGRGGCSEDGVRMEGGREGEDDYYDNCRIESLLCLCFEFNPVVFFPCANRTHLRL